MTQRVKSPIVTPVTGTGQWTDGEAISDLLLHRRIDPPLDTLGAIGRSFGPELDRFRAVCPVSTAVTAGASPPFVVEEDTAAAFNGTAQQYVVPHDGVYLISAAMQPGSAAIAGTLNVTSSLTGMTGFFSYSMGGTAGTGQGPQIALPLRLKKGDTIGIVVNVAFTTSTIAGTNFLMINQLTWG